MSEVDLVALFVFLGIFLLCTLAYLFARFLFVGENDRQALRLMEGVSRKADGASIAEIRKRMVFGPLTEPLAGTVPQMKREAASLEVELRRAGLYKPSARVEYLAIRNVAIWVALLTTAAVFAVIAPSSTRGVLAIWIIGLIVAAIAYSVPRFVIGVIGNRRVIQIQKGLPDSLDMIAMSVSGGLSLHDALKQVSREMAVSYPALAFELELVQQQTEMGTLDQALRQFAHRIDAPEVRQMAALVSQSERLGTNVVRALQDHADNIRRSQRATADERASKTGVKMLFPLVFCMAPSVFIILLVPALMDMSNFFRTERREGGALSQPADLNDFRFTPGQEQDNF